MSSEETNRKMFLSYVTLAIVGSDIYDNKAYLPVNECKGYLYIDGQQQSLCIRGEHVYLELDLQNLKKDLKLAKP